MLGGAKMPTKRNLTVRLDDRTREALELIAARDMRPLANQINFFLREAIGTYLSRNGLILRENTEDHFLSLVPDPALPEESDPFVF
jgi:hypothetical protein